MGDEWIFYKPTYTDIHSGIKTLNSPEQVMEQNEIKVVLYYIGIILKDLIKVLDNS